MLRLSRGSWDSADDQWSRKLAIMSVFFCDAFQCFLVKRNIFKRLVSKLTIWERSSPGWCMCKTVTRFERSRRIVCEWHKYVFACHLSPKIATMIPPEDFLIPAPSLTLGANPASTVVIRKSKQIELHMLHTAVPLSITNLVNPISVAAYTTIHPSIQPAGCLSVQRQERDELWLQHMPCVSMHL